MWLLVGHHSREQATVLPVGEDWHLGKESQRALVARAAKAASPLTPSVGGEWKGGLERS